MLSRRDVDKLQLLSIVVAGLLLLHPMELFSAGFQLGFFCITGLILFAPPILRWVNGHDEEDQATRVKRGIVSRAWRWLRTWIVCSLVAWAVSLPIVAYQFGQISPWVIPCSILLFPIVTLALMGGCAKILFTLMWPSLSGICAIAARHPVTLMKDSAALLSHLPGAALPVTAPSIGIIAIYYALLILPFFPWRWRLVRRGTAALAALTFCCFVASLTLGYSTTPLVKGSDSLAITFLDIGAGQCAVVQAPDSLPTMIDAGSSTISDVTRTCLAPFLVQRGCHGIGAVILSHSDYDHISAVSTALPMFGISAVYTSHYFAQFASVDPPAQSLLNQLNRLKRTPHLLGRGDHLQLSPDLTIDVLWPPADCPFNCNNTGLVLRLTYGGRRVLFPADIQADAMRELLKSPADLKADVLIAPHHGSSEVTTPAFVTAIDPLLIISSNGSPLTEKQRRFEQMIGHRTLYRTSNCGAITLNIDPHGVIIVDTFREAQTSK